MSTPVLSRDEYFQALQPQLYHKNYLAMYSSQWGGIVTDPALWTVPADDHLVHRGDGAFEVFKCVNGLAYCVDDHLEKLSATADRLGIKKPTEFSRIREILRDTVRAGGEKDALVRIILSRGPGGFTSSPYESPVGLLLINVLRLTRYSDEKYERGVRVVSATVPAKDPEIATMKICSYAQNVLVKKEALDAGADYAVSFDRGGFLTESATENVAIVTPKRELLAPQWPGILRGSTLTRLMDLGRGMVKDGLLADARHRDISRQEVAAAAEAFICSTSTDVLPITSWDGRPVGDGRQGAVSKELLARMRAEYTNPASPFVTEMW